ncbi:OsmC family protein [Candidatus Phytoplasma fraxini]|uniref:OsmC family protein n=1 Tax=Ash yellows phytoplasma TaxID=35780 RepID=A0ABZ2U8T3_ASHYP
MNQIKIIGYYEEKFKGLGIIKNGLKTKLISALLNSNEDYSKPNELVCLSILYCFYTTAKNILAIQNNNISSSDIKIKILCNTLKDQKGFYFQIDLFFSIKTLSIPQIKEIMDLTHIKCPVSRLFHSYPHINLIPVLFQEI